MREQEDEEEDEEDVLRTERAEGKDGSVGRVCSSGDVIARARRAHAILSRPESTEIDRRAVLFTARPPAGCIIIILVVVVTTDQSR